MTFKNETLTICVYVCDDDATPGLFFYYAQQANTGHHC